MHLRDSSIPISPSISISWYSDPALAYIKMLLIYLLPLFSSLLSVASATNKHRPKTKGHNKPLLLPPIPVAHVEALTQNTPVVSRNGTQLPPYSQEFYFHQLIDHNNPDAGTFQQRYWHTYEFYEPGTCHFCLCTYVMCYDDFLHC